MQSRIRGRSLGALGTLDEGQKPESAHRHANPREVIAAARVERRAKVIVAYKLNLIAKKRQLEKAKRVLELDRKLIVIAVLIIALPIIAALATMLTALAVGGGLW